MTVDELVNELQQTLNDINTQIHFLDLEAKHLGVRLFQFRNTQGEYLLAPLLAAKATILSSIAKL